MNRVALLIGGNQGDSDKLLQQAIALIEQRIGNVRRASIVYRTAPWGTFDRDDVADFLNQALVVETPLSAHEVLRQALEIEAELGRVRKAPPCHPQTGTTERIYHSRPMDIDLIFYNDEVIDTPDLTIPHPRMHLRRFVLEPLAEIMPDYRHPVLRKTVHELLSTL